MDGIEAVELAFTLRPGHWVDVDTLAETALAGLRDGGVLGRGYAGLDALLATKAFGAQSGLRATARRAEHLRTEPVPGPVLVDVAGPGLPSSAEREHKRAWRGRVAAAWGPRPSPAGDLWAEVVHADSGSITRGLEALLDVLEPVLGRDPRGRSWQEFFPNDDRIVWLRVHRAAGGPARRLRLGTIG